MEKTKATLEAENQEMASDLKSVQMAKQESERKRKQAEQQLAELSVRLAEVERGRGETTDRVSKLQAELDQVCGRCTIHKLLSVCIHRFCEQHRWLHVLGVKKYRQIQ